MVTATVISGVIAGMLITSTGFLGWKSMPLPELK